MDRAQLILRLERIERKIKLMYYVDAERMIEEMLKQLGCPSSDGIYCDKHNDPNCPHD